MPTLQWEVLLHWAAVLLYVVAGVLFSVATIFEWKKLHWVGAVFAILGLVPHSIAIIIRWVVSGHGPYMLRYEVLSSNAWVFIVMYLLASLRWPKLRFAGMIVLPYAFLTMAYGLFSNPEVRKLPPSLRSIWLVLHVTFYKLSVGAILMSLACAVFFLVIDRRGRRGFLDRLPAQDSLDIFGYRFATFGFTFWTVGVLSGSIWANQSWGRYWNWDPIETWSFITWLFYGLYLHTRFFLGWKGRRAAWFLIGCFALSFVTAFVIPFVAPTIHESYFT